VVAALVGAVVADAYIVFGAWQWSQFAVKSWDLAIFAQALQRYAALEVPLVPVKGDGFNLLGDHFHPLLALLAPVYAVFPHAFTLVVVQAVCFGVSAALFTRAAQRRLRPGVAVALGLAFGFAWALQYTAEVQFHEVALAVPLLTASLVAVYERRWVPAALWAAPLVFVKEDLGLTVVAVGVLIIVRARRPLGLWLVAWGLSWFAIATLVVLPLLNPAGAWAYGGSANPSAVFSDLAALVDPSKGETLLLIVAVSAGLVLRSPFALLLLPTLAWRFLSSNHGYWGPSWHYSAVLIPVAFCALLDGLRLLRASRRRWLRAYARFAPAVALTVAVLLLPALPLWSMLSPGAWAPPPRAAAASAVLERIAHGAVVESDIGLMSYLVDDHGVFWTGNDNPVPDCILIDLQAGGTPGEWGQVLAVATRLHPDTPFEVRYDHGGYQLACRV
jgi:uncharacterized membrane protein